MRLLLMLETAKMFAWSVRTYGDEPPSWWFDGGPRYRMHEQERRQSTPVRDRVLAHHDDTHDWNLRERSALYLQLAWELKHALVALHAWLRGERRCDHCGGFYTPADGSCGCFDNDCQ